MRQYLLSLITSALLCSVVYGLLDKKSGYFPIIKLICGLFITVTAISPLTNISIPDISGYIGDTKFDANRFINEGQTATYESIASIITANLESYILDVANEIGADIQVQIILDDQTPPSPHSVKIMGNVSPYKKQQIQQIIEKQLGIPEEHQIWM